MVYIQYLWIVATCLQIMQVKNPCPARKKSGEVTFLTATFNCCSTEDRPKQNVRFKVTQLLLLIFMHITSV